MKVGLSNLAIVVVPILLLSSLSLQAVEGIRFVIDREECFSHNVQYERDTIHVSFVVIKIDSSWQYTVEGVDIVVMGPSGEKVHELMDKTSEKFDFVAANKGLHRFCFTNRSPYHETIDFDIYVSHLTAYDQHVKDEHFNPLLQQISKLEEALYNIQFEQHWLEAQTERQAIANNALSSRAVQKAIFESAVLIGGSLLQVFLLRRLFEQKGGPPRV
ncbi:transmembrane emp24 domain-containing protein p24beta2-like [Prosopis cineraria]|uniref:transmembrane emp24 domain-containing protein p24beta2-like n=1 Tax=Prosopis cineraria TaxID=364024 RepID=UPI00240F43CD|nr:transmembrane emp24 domain-containing protein p24beta2-like [Prosopis cineraria]